MIRVFGKFNLSKRALGRGIIMLLIVFLVCLNPGMALAMGENGGTSGEGDSSGQGGTSGQGGSQDDGKLVVKIETVKLSGKSGTVIVSCEGGSASCYYLLVKEAGSSEPTAEEIKSKGTKSRDGFISMPSVTENVEYVIYVVAEDAAGNLSKVVSRKAASSSSRGIEILGHIYCTLQTRDEIDDYTNEPGEITINVGSVKNIKKVEYIIADKFVNSTGMIDAIATEDKDVTTSAGTSSITLSTWSEYDEKEKPGLVRNMLNYVYVRMTDTDDNYTYFSSRGIWEDETLPLALSVTGKADETSAVVTVTGEDEESGLKKYYFMYRDPIDLSPVEPEYVKLHGMESEDGIFEISGLAKRTSYDMYAVVEDLAGNLSTVISGSLTTEGEAEASAVRESSDTSGNPGTASNVDQRTDGVSLEDEEVTQNVAELTPYLVGSEEKEYAGLIKIIGWDDIKAVAEKTKEPGDIYIAMNGGAVVPGDVLAKVSGRNVNCHFIMDDTFIWVINGRDLSVEPASTDLRVSANSGLIPAKLITDLAGVYPYEEFSVEHYGTFSFNPQLVMRLGGENEGKNAYLYCYNQNDFRLELLDTVEVNDTGKVSFELPDSADYVVIVGPVQGTDQPEEETTEGYQRNTESKANDFVNEPKSSGKLWIIIITVIALLLFGFILFMPKGKTNDASGSSSDDDLSDM